MTSIIIIATIITLLTITINYHDKVEQREEGEAVSADSLALVQRYNDIIASLTEAFFQVGMRGKKIIKDFSLHKSYQIAGGYCDHQSRKGGWDYF